MKHQMQPKCNKEPNRNKLWNFNCCGIREGQHQKQVKRTHVKAAIRSCVISSRNGYILDCWKMKTVKEKALLLHACLLALCMHWLLFGFSTRWFGQGVMQFLWEMGIAGKNSGSETGFLFCNVIVVFFKKVGVPCELKWNRNVQK